MGKGVADISKLIDLAEQGDQEAVGKLFSLLYTELHGLAKRQLARQGIGGLSATTLIHEAYLNMARREESVFPDQARFLAYVARVMRGIIIDQIRNRLAVKRGGQFEIMALTTSVGQNLPDDHELMRLSDALDELAMVDSSLSQIVDLKFFCGFSFNEIANMEGLSERSVQRKWEKARLYLYRTLQTCLPS